MKRSLKLTAIGITVASLALGLSGCAGTAKVTKSAETQPGISASISGKVLETMDGGGYTYVYLEKDGKKTWAALPATKIAVGDQIKILGGAVMAPFSSKALNRNFDSVIFSGGLDRGTAAGSPKVADGANNTQGAPVLAGKVLETMAVQGYTYILLEKDGNKGWAAIPTTDLQVGDEVELIPGIDMGNFQSALLQRSFDNIHFSAGLKGERKRAPEAAAPAAGAAGTAGASADGGGLPQGHPKLDGAPAAPAPAPEAVAGAPQPPLTGKVVETMNAGGYTYICLEKDSVKKWAAVSRYPVTVGQELTLAPGNVMHNFTSRSLKRTFDEIIFTARPQTN